MRTCPVGQQGSLYELRVYAHRPCRTKIGLECLMLAPAWLKGIAGDGQPPKPSPCGPRHESASLSQQSPTLTTVSHTWPGNRMAKRVSTGPMAKGSAHSWPGGADHAGAASEGLLHVQRFCPIWASLLHGIKLQVRAGEGYPASLAGAMSRLWGRSWVGADHARNPFVKT